MRIEAVTVCASTGPGKPSYHDFLDQTARHNRGLVDRWLIVTAPWDEATREVCRKHNLDVLVTGEGTRGEDAFAKGWLVERGLQQLSAPRSGAWRLHLDADVVLPATARLQLEAADLDPACVYGCDRALVRSWQEWQRVLASGWLQMPWDYHHRVRWPEGLPVGARWASPSAGWVPIGFFQMWSSEIDEWHGARVRPYPHRHGTACRTDVQFGLCFDRRKRALIPELIVLHLESEPAALGANWNGRTTKQFGPPESGQAGKPGCSY